jgi:thiamine transport system ATP-binding protein
MAVMRSGRLVQEGPVSQVWEHPADAETALFLGYARVLRGEAARVVLAAAGAPGSPAVAVRRSALRVEPDGPLAGTVVSVTAAPEQVRLVVEVAGVGAVDAVAAPGTRPVPGEAVRLGVDVTRLAPVAHE